MCQNTVQNKFHGASVLFPQARSHIASVFLVLTVRLNIRFSSCTSFGRLLTMAWSLTSNILMSVNCESFFFFFVNVNALDIIF